MGGGSAEGWEVGSDLKGDTEYSKKGWMLFARNHQDWSIERERYEEEKRILLCKT